jgi:double-stranded uracil-DNA glycosylase
MTRPSPADLAAAAGRSIPDVIAPGLAVLFCGINPGLWSAAVGQHFARPGNRFWPALHRSGFTDRQLRPDEQRELLGYRLGVTNLVARGSARADELSAAELLAGGRQLAAKIRRYQPEWLAVLGIGAYRTAFGQDRPGGAAAGQRRVTGEQRRRIGATRIWVLPNPSGLNASWATPRLVEAFQEFREVAQS